MIFNLEASDLPEGWTPLEAIAVVKGLDENGEVSIAIRPTSGLTSWECTGMLIEATDVLRHEARVAWPDADRDGDE